MAIEAKSDDPEELKRQVARLSKQFVDMKTYAEALELKIAKRPEKIKVERPGKPIKVPALSAKMLSKVQATKRAFDRVAKTIAEAEKSLANVIADGDGTIHALISELDRAEKLAKAHLDALRVKPEPEQVGRATYRQNQKIGAEAFTALAAHSSGVPSTNGDGSKGSVTGGRARILKALAQQPKRITMRRARVLAGIESQATFDTYMSQFRKAGYVLTEGDLVWITSNGLEALGPFDPLPTGQALVSYWKQELGTHGRGKIFSVLIDRPDQRFTRERLKAEAGISSDATLDTYLSQLRSRGLVVTSKDGYATIDPSFEGI